MYGMFDIAGTNNFHSTACISMVRMWHRQVTHTPSSVMWRQVHGITSTTSSITPAAIPPAPGRTTLSRSLLTRERPPTTTTSTLMELAASSEHAGFLEPGGDSNRDRRQGSSCFGGRAGGLLKLSELVCVAPSRFQHPHTLVDVGQPNRERQALSFITLDRQFAAMLAHDAPDDKQS
jgi:hypothetical protein